MFTWVFHPDTERCRLCDIPLRGGARVTLARRPMEFTERKDERQWAFWRVSFEYLDQTRWLLLFQFFCDHELWQLHMVGIWQWKTCRWLSRSRRMVRHPRASSALDAFSDEPPQRWWCFTLVTRITYMIGSLYCNFGLLECAITTCFFFFPEEFIFNVFLWILRICLIICWCSPPFSARKTSDRLPSGEERWALPAAMGGRWTHRSWCFCNGPLSNTLRFEGP